MRKGDILPFRAPTWGPQSQSGNLAILLVCTVAAAAMQGYDVSMMGGMNILPQYTEYFELSDATRSLNIATNYVGGCLACFCWGSLIDNYGRRNGLFWSATLTVLAAGLQAGAVHISMFCIARIIIGFATTASVIAGSAYLAETLPWNKRAWGLSLFNDFFYVGAIVAAGVTYSSFKMEGTWSWRLPSLLQGIWGLFCLALLPWLPESPRWLIDQGRPKDALVVLARVNADGDTRDDLVRLQFCQIVDTITYERNPMTYKEMLCNRGARKRLIITATCALFSMMTGNIIVMYNIGDMLHNVGVDDHSTQLLLNVGLNAASLLVSICGSFYTDRLGVKSAAIVSTAGTSLSLFILGALTRYYCHSTESSGVWASVSCIFLFAASYAFGWIPVLFLLPAEVLYFRIRAKGMAMFSLVVNITGIWGNFVFPLALGALEWRLWIINGAWNLLFVGFIWWYWVEIKGKTLEEIDALFDGKKHSDMPDIEDVLSSNADENWKGRPAMPFLTPAWCHATDVSYLTSLAYCFEHYCGQGGDKVLNWKLEKFWSENVASGKEPKWSYREALHEARMRLGDEKPRVWNVGVMNYTAAANQSRYDSVYGLIILILIMGAGIPVVAALIRFLPWGAACLDRLAPFLHSSIYKDYNSKVPPYWLGNAATIGQGLYVLSFFSLDIVLSAIDYRTHWPHRMRLAFAVAPLVKLLASRNNILPWLSNWSHGTFLVLHRWVGRVFVVQSVVHSIVELHVYIHMGRYPNEEKKPYWIWVVTATIMAVAILFFGATWIRRKHYELFLVTHIVLVIFVLAGSWYHVQLCILANVVEGPYKDKSHDELMTCDRLVCFAGGVGNTSVLEFAATHPNSKLSWSMKDSDAPLAKDLEGVTNNLDESEVSVGQRFNARHVPEVESEGLFKKVGVVVCGPEALCDEVRAIVTRLGRHQSSISYSLSVEAFPW
ncbi:Lactose permease [Paramyrothecium foliicola]|nr:Lactose permease [Paramyrothecium foliicola]